MNNRHWIGVDLGGTNIRVGLLNDEGIIIKERKELTEAEKGPDYIIEKIKHMIDMLKPGFKVEGIGIGMPGPLNPYKGIVLNPVNLPGWNNINLSSILWNHYTIPCFIENDCNVAALAEAVCGAGKGFPVVFYITVSTGVGGGLCINGNIHSGATGNAGEIANIIVRENGTRHSFLNPGSLEGSASGISILRMAHEKGLQVNKAHEVFELAERGNPSALEVSDYAIDSLSRGMAAIAHVVDPHIFVLGGGVATSVPGFIQRVRDKFEQYIYEVMRGQIKVEPARLQDPGMTGAMLMAKKRINK